MRLARPSLLRSTFAIAALVSAIGVASCNDDLTEPSVDSVSGTYVATTFNSTTGGRTTNELARGASISITLSENGTTLGTAFVPGPTDPLNAGLIGTWDLVSNIVSIDGNEDTFLNDMPLQVAGDVLLGEQTFGATRVQLVLTRQSR